MSYTIKKDEVVLVLRPQQDGSKWNGSVETGIAFHEDNDFEKETLRSMIDLVTLMSAFLEVSQYDEYVYDTVADARDDMLRDMFEFVEEKDDPLHTYEEVEGTNGKVLKLTPNTPTKGSA